MGSFVSLYLLIIQSNKCNVKYPQRNRRSNYVNCDALFISNMHEYFIDETDSQLH